MSTATTLLGTPVSCPVAVAPTTLQRAAHPDGEVAMARGVAASGTLMVVSSNAGSTFDDIAATGVPWWLQAYLTADRSASLPLLRRAVEAGARAVVLTVDTPVVGTKYDEGPTVWELTEPGWLHVNFPPGYGELAGHEKATNLGYEDITWLTEMTDGSVRSNKNGPGERAISDYVVTRVVGDVSLVRVTLLTGRKHQIRVHMLHRGAAVVGDPVYNPKDKAERLMLAAVELGFDHPTGGKRVNFKIPLPGPMKQLLKSAEHPPLPDLRRRR